jgi:hypothetical protein
MNQDLRRAALIVFAASVALLIGGSRPGTAASQQPPSEDYLTPLVVSATNSPIGVLGSDGQQHLEYDLVLTNVFTAPVTLDSLDVTTLDGSVLLHLTGDALAANTQPFTITVDQSPAPISQIPAGGTVATVIDLVVPPEAVPSDISHVLTYELPPDTPLLSLLSGRTTFGPVLTVDPRTALAIASPVQGSGWLNANGCCDASLNHRYIREALNGYRYIKPETFAIDWLQLKNGQLYMGDGMQNEQYFDFGADIVSVAPGTVVSVRDGMPEQTPNQAPVGVNAVDDYIGNHVVVQLKPDVWALYAHLQTGSVAVRVGDQVATGQLLGRVGNSGNSFGPHLHFQLSDGPVALTSESVPYVFDRYTLAGMVDVAAVEAAASTPEGGSVAGGAGPLKSVPINATSLVQTGTYPLALTVQDFP